MRDMDIRTALHERLRSEHDMADTQIREELGLCNGSVRVDIAVINGSITGYEIKSPEDTLRRLPYQVELYDQVLDASVLVTSNKYLEPVESIVSPWWGILRAETGKDGLVFFEERAPTPNPAIKPASLVRLLWRSETLEELERLYLDAGVRSAPRSALWSRLAEALSVDELRAVVRTRLKARNVASRGKQLAEQQM